MSGESVAIIGASGPGLFGAYLLARQGVAVDVYEQAEELVPAPRTLIVTPALTEVLGFMPRSAIVHRVAGFDLRSNGTLARVALEEPDFVVERSELLRLLASRAEQAGARLHFGRQFCGFEKGRQTRVLLRERETGRVLDVAATAVIGADGVHSAVARALGRPSLPTVSNLQAQVSLPEGADPGVSQVWFAPPRTPYFYWCIPDSPRTAVVGLAIQDAAEARRALDAFLQERNLEPIAYQAARTPLYAPGRSPRARVGETEVFLVGDAAGQVKATTVGGTVTGLRGARAATRAILGSSSDRALPRLDRELLLHWLLRRVLNRFREEHYTALLWSLNERLHRLLRFNNRDQLTGALWQMLAVQPMLPLLAFHAVASGARRG